jgi:hypothetical protein
MATFRTEQSWGDLKQWHQAPNLSIDLTDGDSNNLTGISWQKADGTEGSISFQDNLTSFLGFYRKPNEGPIAYRGQRIS